MSLLVGAGLAYCGFVGGYFLNEFGLPKLKKRKAEAPADENMIRTQEYTKLFTSIGLMDTTKGDWIQCRGVDTHTNYRSVCFKLSDTLSYTNFKKSIEIIREKMQIKHLEVFEDGGYMYFKVRNEVIELQPYEFNKTQKHLIPLGLDLDDVVVNWNLKDDPHMLICGSTGCGKSRLLNSMINHMYNNFNGSTLYLVDLKRGIEFSQYENTNNCVSYAEELAKVKNVIKEFDDEQEKRYKILKEAGYRDYNEYVKDKPNSNLKRAFLIIDEFADLMALNKTTKKEEYNVVDVIVEIARKCRCCGMHVICATQRPTTNFISSDLKANLSCIIGMKAMNELNSRLIIDEVGLEELNRAEAVGIIGSKKIFFRAYKFDQSITDETVKKFAKSGDKNGNGEG